jgi:hypothetical protein
VRFCFRSLRLGRILVRTPWCRINQIRSSEETPLGSAIRLYRASIGTFLGQPNYTFSVVLASLLIFAGVGSWLAGLVRNLTYDVLARFLLAGVLVILFDDHPIRSLLGSGLGFALAGRHFHPARRSAGFGTPAVRELASICFGQFLGSFRH